MGRNCQFELKTNRQNSKLDFTNISWFSAEQSDKNIDPLLLIFTN